MVHEPLDEVRWQHVLRPLRAVCLWLPEANETVNFGHPWFRAGRRVFAIFEVHDGEAGASFRAAPMEHEELLADPGITPTPYMRHHGWLTLRLGEPVEWDRVEALLLDSYRL